MRNLYKRQYIKLLKIQKINQFLKEKKKEKGEKKKKKIIQGKMSRFIHDVNVH